MKTICVDSCFLIALYDETEVTRHSRAESIFLEYFDVVQNQLLVPWPILYESISTRMVKNRKRMDMLNRDWKTLEKQGRLVLLDDLPFRKKAITESFKELQKEPGRYRALSLADRVIRNILCEVEIDGFITFNVGDFVDVCTRFHRVIIV